MVNGKHYQINLTKVNLDDTYNFMLTDPQTLHFTYRNFEGNITVENKMPSDLLYINNTVDLERYRTEDSSHNYYLIDSPLYKGVYINLEEDYRGAVTFGENIHEIYLYQKDYRLSSKKFRLITKADSVNIYINNVSIYMKPFLESQSQLTHLFVFGINYITGEIKALNDLIIETYGELYLSAGGNPTVSADNLIIKGKGKTSVYGDHGYDGYDGWYEGDDGYDGDDGFPAIKVSGKVTIESADVLVSGGNGGYGGNGIKSIPGLFVKGGDGGDGGDGAPAIIARQVSINKQATIVAGRGGKGGKGGEAVGIGWEGADGKDGLNPEAIKLLD